jgi:Tfp pilus assembly protein PilX
MFDRDLTRAIAVKRILQAKPGRRLGVILAAVLLSLLVVMLVGGELAKAISLQHRQARLAEDRLQAFWIAESAVQRAVRALAKAPEYAGETWRVPAEALGSGRAGVATIKIESAAGAAPPRRILVQAYYPEDPIQRTLYERELVLD